MSNGFSFNTLVQNSDTVAPTGLPTGFDTNMALLLATCCSLSYQQYSLGKKDISDLLDQLPFQDTWSYQQTGNLTGSEPLGFGAATTGPGAFVTVPFGFLLAVSDNTGPIFNVLTLRGTQTFAEWLNDVEAVPTFFMLDSSSDTPALVHGGFYNQYTVGTDGSTPSSSGTNRVAGSLAAQVASLVTGLGTPTLPLYVTGHSLGAALAAFAALDVALNFASAVSSVTMYHFAPPQVSAGLAISSLSLTFSTTQFSDNFSAHVKGGGFAVVNAADIVPILPMGSVTFGSSTVTLSFSPVVSSPVVYCAQLENIELNHSLEYNYLPYVTQLQQGFS